MGSLLLRLITTLLVIVLLYQCWLLGWVLWYGARPPGSTAFMRHELHRLQQDTPAASLRYRWVPYDHIAPALKRAVVAAEDSRFVEHMGVDWQGIEKAYQHNQSLAARQNTAKQKGRNVASKPLRGGSTLTQQLAKNLFLSSEQSYLRKAQELIIAWMIEATMDKRRILELYLNVVEWGDGVFGAEAAAQYYFQVSAQQLSPAQAARLAAMLPRPKYFDQHRNSAYLSARAQTLQARLSSAQLP